MPDHDRSPRRWTYAVVVAWAVGGCVSLMTWRDTAWWLAVPLSLVLAGATMLFMRLVPEIRLRAPSKDTLDNASIFRLNGVAKQAQVRVSRWINNGLDDGARTHAETALDRLSAIIKLIGRCDTRQPDEDMRVAVRATVQSIEYSTSVQPSGAADWRSVKRTMEDEYEALSYAVKQRGLHR